MRLTTAMQRVRAAGIAGSEKTEGPD